MTYEVDPAGILVVTSRSGDIERFRRAVPFGLELSTMSGVRYHSRDGRLWILHEAEWYERIEEAPSP